MSETLVKQARTITQMPQTLQSRNSVLMNPAAASTTRLKLMSKTQCVTTLLGAAAVTPKPLMLSNKLPLKVLNEDEIVEMSTLQPEQPGQCSCSQCNQKGQDTFQINMQLLMEEIKSLMQLITYTKQTPL